MSEKTVSHIFIDASKRPPSQVAFKYFSHGSWQTKTWGEYYKLAENLAGSLLSLGVRRGDKIAIMSNTRHEWAVSDMAILGIGCITIPLYQNNTAEDVEFILNNSGATVVFLEDEDQYHKIQHLKDKVQSLKHFISFVDIPAKEVLSWTDAQTKGEEYSNSHPDFFAQEVQKNKIDDIATIVYTSGTTGVPKGAVLPHSCIKSECEDVKPILDVNEKDSTLTFLPFAHIFGRVEMWAHIYFGWQMNYAESIDRLATNLSETRPTFMLAVPRVFEKIYGRIISQVEEGSAAKKKIFAWAVKIGTEISMAKRQKKMPSFAVLLQYKVAHKLVFSKLHQRMGGRMRFLISGSAPLSKEIIEFFHAAGIMVLEGYGLTESTAGIWFNTMYKYNFGSVGIPIGDVQGKIADDGEILVKSKKIFREYYKNPEATNEAFTDGWFHTGDIGVIDSDGFLKITDRKKDMLKTAGGKMIAPQKIENLLKLDSLISQVAVYGDKQKYLVALLTLNPENLLKLAQSQGISEKDVTILARDPKILEVVRDILKEKNSKLASYETIKNFAVLPKEFTVEAGEITPSLKVKRKFVAEKYAKQIAELYN